MTLTTTPVNPKTLESSSKVVAALTNAASILGYSGSVTDTYGVSATANSVLVQADGKIVVVGSAYNVNTSSVDFAISRYNSNGSLDTTFIGDGRQTTDFGYDGAYSVSALAGGKLLVSGISVDPATNISYYVQSQYMSNGSLDTSFDGDGKASRVLTDTDSFGQGVATQADGKLLQLDTSTGFSVVRYGLDGELDPGFGTNGIVSTDFLTATGSTATPRQLAVQTDGKIVVAGNASNGSIALARYNTNGSLDSSFSTDGILTENFGSKVYANSVAVQADGKIVVAGYTLDSTGNNQLLLARFNADGSVDKQFNNVIPAKPGLSFTNTANLVTTEAGGTASFGVALKTAPHHDVFLTLTSNDATEGVFTSTQTPSQTVTFTPTNWNQVQTVSLKGVDDKIVDGDIAYIISTKVTSDDLTYDGMRSGTGLPIANIIVTNSDDDAPDTKYGDRDPRILQDDIYLNDVLIGGNGASDIYGKDGRDELHGGNGDDRLYGGYGDDVLYGEADNDQLEGEQGDDKLYGGDGNDTLNGGTGNDKLSGGNGNDVLDGNQGADTMDGGNGADTYYVDNAGDVVSDSGTDTGVVDTVNIASYISSTFKYTLGVGIENAVLNDTAKDADLTGNASNNTLTGNAFDNQLAGGDGTDTLKGGAGNDSLTGGSGNDQLLGGDGNDLVFGGAIRLC